MPNTATQNEKVVAISKLWWVGLVAIVCASIVNIIFFLITKYLFGVTYPGLPPGGYFWLVIYYGVYNIRYAIGATILLAILSIFLSRPFRVFWSILILLFLVFFLAHIPVEESSNVKAIVSTTLNNVISVLIIGVVLTKFSRKKKSLEEPSKVDETISNDS